MRRRSFLTISATALGGSLIYTLDRTPLRIHAQDARKIRVPLRFFDERGALIIAAAAARIFPGDASGPGASEAGVVIYIDRQLAGPYGRDQFRYTKAPWTESVPEHGYQGRDTPREIYRAGIARLGEFAGLSPEQQDERLRAIESSLFFQMLRRHTLEGMFCDPHHGGNANMIGWQLIGYPGPRMSYRDEIGSNPSPPKWRPVSLEQALG